MLNAAPRRLCQRPRCRLAWWRRSASLRNPVYFMRSVGSTVAVFFCGDADATNVQMAGHHFSQVPRDFLSALRPARAVPAHRRRGDGADKTRLLSGCDTDETQFMNKRSVARTAVAGRRRWSSAHADGPWCGSTTIAASTASSSAMRLSAVRAGVPDFGDGRPAGRRVKPGRRKCSRWTSGLRHPESATVLDRHVMEVLGNGPSRPAVDYLVGPLAMSFNRAFR